MYSHDFTAKPFIGKNEAELEFQVVEVRLGVNAEKSLQRSDNGFFREQRNSREYSLCARNVMCTLFFRSAMRRYWPSSTNTVSSIRTLRAEQARNSYQISPCLTTVSD